MWVGGEEISDGLVKGASVSLRAYEWIHTYVQTYRRGGLGDLAGGGREGVGGDRHHEAAQRVGVGEGGEGVGLVAL